MDDLTAAGERADGRADRHPGRCGRAGPGGRTGGGARVRVDRGRACSRRVLDDRCRQAGGRDDGHHIDVGQGCAIGEGRTARRAAHGLPDRRAADPPGAVGPDRLHAAGHGLRDRDRVALVRAGEDARRDDVGHRITGSRRSSGVADRADAELGNRVERQHLDVGYLVLVGDRAGRADEAEGQLLRDAGRRRPAGGRIQPGRHAGQRSRERSARGTDRLDDDLVGSRGHDYPGVGGERRGGGIHQDLYRDHGRSSSSGLERQPRTGSAVVGGGQAAVTDEALARTAYDGGTRDRGDDLRVVRASGALEASTAEVPEHVQADAEVGVGEAGDRAGR